MTNLHAQHSKGWSGLAFVVLLIVSIFLTGLPPTPGASNGAVENYLAGAHNGILISAWLAFPLGAFFLWFVVGQAAFLRRASAEDDGLPTYVLVAGTFVTAAAWIGSVLLTGLAYSPSSDASSFVWTLQAYLNGAFLSMPLAILIFAAAHSMRRHGSGPPWLIWLGYSTALLQAVGTLGIFSPTGMPAGSLILGLAGVLLFVVYMAAASVHLIVSAGGKERAGVTSPA